METYLKKILLLGLTMGGIFSLAAQAKYKLINSEVHFFSEAPLENIEAINQESIGIVDCGSHKFLFRIPIKDFVFEKGLMQDHFNENYLESGKFPNAIYQGTINGGINMDDNGTYPIVISGELEIHGVKQQRKISATIEVKGNSVKLNGKFIVKLEDHDIDIPTLVFNKIAEEIEVTFQSDLSKI